MQQAGLKIDYLLWYKFPKSKREKLLELAKIVDKKNIELMEAFGIARLFT